MPCQDGEAIILRPKPNIYGGDIARHIQQVVYGREAFASEYKYILSDPFPIVLLYTPLALLSNFPLVRAIWMLVAEVALLAVSCFPIASPSGIHRLA